MALMWLPFGLTPRPKSKGGVHYADIYVRALAAGIDVFLLFFVLGDFLKLVQQKIYAHADLQAFSDMRAATNAHEIFRVFFESGLFRLMLINYAVQTVIIAALLISVQIIWDTTPGKRLMGIRIVSAEALEPIARWRYILRFLAYIPGIFGFFWVSFNKQRRGWHDYIAGTVVIHTKPEGWYWEQVKRLWRKYVMKKPPATPESPE